MKNKIKIGKLTLQGMAINLAEELERDDFIGEDAKIGGVNHGFLLMSIYEILLDHFNRED